MKEILDWRYHWQCFFVSVFKFNIIHQKLFGNKKHGIIFL